MQLTVSNNERKQRLEEKFSSKFNFWLPTGIQDSIRMSLGWECTSDVVLGTVVLCGRKEALVTVRAQVLKQILSLCVTSYSGENRWWEWRLFQRHPFNDTSINFHGRAYKVPHKTLVKVPYKIYSFTDNLEWQGVSKQCATLNWGLERG